MYYLIRWSRDDEVAGIMDTGGNILFYSGGRSAFQNRLIVAVKEYFNTESHFSWERISQAEYGTYRDLHGFEVIKCSS